MPNEVIVIGSGATGGVAALSFAEAGIKVLVVEAGPNLSLKQAIGSEPSNTLKRLHGLINRRNSIQAQHPGYWKTNPHLYIDEREHPYTFPAEKPFIWTRGMQVGGRSLTWGGITLRLSDYEFKASRNDGIGLDWPISYKDLSDHYDYLEKLLKVHGNNDHLEQLPDGKQLKAFPFTKSELLFKEKLISSLNYPFIHSRGFGPYQYSKDKEWPISSSIGSTLKTAINTGNVELLPNHMVEKIMMNKDQNSASGVILIDQSNGKRVKIEAKLIVLCASTIQSIKILLNSKETEEPNGLIDPSNSIGNYLMDHVSTCRFFRTDNNEAQNNSDFQKQILSGAGSFFIPFGTNFKYKHSQPFKRGYGIWGGIDRFGLPKCINKEPNSVIGFLIAHGEVLPSSSNKVSLSTKVDRFDSRIPHIDFQWSENEINMVKNMNQNIQEIIESSDGEMLPIEDLINAPFLNIIAKKSLALGEEAPPPGYYIHEVGGARMGTNEKNSVLDPWNRLWRCKNVLVTDGSCWPSSGWQSPTLTMMAITRRACMKAIDSLKE